MREEALRLLRLLVEDYERFFDKRGYLNSEGRKVLERAARELMEEGEQLKGAISKVRRRASYEDVLRLLEILSGPGTA